jgi:asparagine synthase (glutamine-hydrolysing)
VACTHWTEDGKWGTFGARMSGLAVAIDFDRPDPGHESVTRMLAAMPHRSPDGASLATAQHAVLGMALRATTARERAAAQPLNDPAAGTWLVADARIDNREEVARTLGLASPPASDAELLLLGVTRFGPRIASRLEGDFAFVAWDERGRVLTAARDAMGLRPLFWRATAGGLLLASEVDALLDGGGAAEVEPDTVLDYLLRRKRLVARTFFRGIQRLLPGHVLEAGPGGVRDLGHARPVPLEPRPPPNGTEVAGFRSRFRAAVSARIESDGPAVLALSGGLDSSAIACMAEDLHREAPGAWAPLILASASFKGFQGAIDSRYLDAVLARVRFRCERWEASAGVPAAPDTLPRAHPVRDPMPGGVGQVLELARSEGSRVLLLGMGGDQLLFESGVLVDLARHWRLFTLAWETLRGRPYTFAPGHQLFARALRSAAPSWARSAFRAVRERRPDGPPAWMGPALRRRWPPAVSSRTDPAPSQVQDDVGGLLGGQGTHVSVEIMELAAARAGLQLRLPFLDRGLAEWVHAIPWQRRLPRGLMKRLLREAMAGTWPEELARRREVAIADDYILWSLSRSAVLLAATIEGPRWEAADFVSREQAAGLLASIRADDDTTCRTWLELWDIVALERWLRGLRD